MHRARSWERDEKLPPQHVSFFSKFWDSQRGLRGCSSQSGLAISASLRGPPFSPTARYVRLERTNTPCYSDTIPDIRSPFVMYGVLRNTPYLSNNCPEPVMDGLDGDVSRGRGRSVVLALRIAAAERRLAGSLYLPTAGDCPTPYCTLKEAITLRSTPYCQR